MTDRDVSRDASPSRPEPAGPGPDADPDSDPGSAEAGARDGQPCAVTDAGDDEYESL